MEARRLVQVVPPEPVETGETLTRGTKIILDDGSDIEGVYRVDLCAEIDALWHGTIHVYPKVGVMKGMTVAIQEGRGSWWRTLLCRMAGAQVQKTSVSEYSHSWRKP